MLCPNNIISLHCAITKTNLLAVNLKETLINCMRNLNAPYFSTCKGNLVIINYLRLLISHDHTDVDQFCHVMSRNKRNQKLS